MQARHFLIAAAAIVLLGASGPAVAESGVLMPRGPVLSGSDPIFKGLLLSPGYSKCRELRGRSYQWKCTYGDVPADANGRLGTKQKQLRAAKPAKD